MKRLLPSFSMWERMRVIPSKFKWMEELRELGSLQESKAVISFPRWMLDNYELQAHLWAAIEWNGSWWGNSWDSLTCFSANYIGVSCLLSGDFWRWQVFMSTRRIKKYHDTSLMEKTSPWCLRTWGRGLQQCSCCIMRKTEIIEGDRETRNLIPWKEKRLRVWAITRLFSRGP